MRHSLLTACAVAIVLSGCAASVERPTPEMTAPSMQIPVESAKRVVLNVVSAGNVAQDSGWTDFRTEWGDIFSEQGKTAGMQVSRQDGEPKPTGEVGTLLVVRIVDYRYVSIGRRLAFGIMTGNAYINAKMEYRDLKTGAVYGERTYNTTSSAWQGIGAAVTPKQIYALSDEAIAEIKRR